LPEEARKEKKRMGEAINNLVKDFSKNQLIAYFLLIWALTFLLSAISGFIWIAEGHASILDIIVDGLRYMAQIGCAAILAMLGLKILNEPQ
jgi:hypothetical protein